MKLLKITAVAIILLSGAACSKDFEEINTNPTLVTTDIIQPQMLFTAVLKNSIFTTFSNSVFKEYAQYYSNEASGTIFQDQNWTTPFSDYQANLINTAEVIRLTANQPELVNQQAMARIWKVWLFQQMTDAYGDLPYFEALLDVKDVVNQPKYDTQEAIYTDMFKELKEAVAQLSTDASMKSFGSADILFGGNVDKWKRFGNSLKLRLAIRVRYANEELARTNIAEVINEPLIDANSWNAQLATLDDADVNNRNPLYQDAINSNYYPVYVGFTVTQELLKRSDPRLPVFADMATAPTAGYRGRPVALLDAEKVRYSIDSVATLPLSFQQPVYNIIVMNAAEIFLIRAEAARAGLTSEDAEELYRNGISASLEQYKVTGSAADAYMNSNFTHLNGADEEEDLEDIIVQKYLAMYHQGTEGWAEFRRTGYPKIWTGSDFGSTHGNIPRRLTYPQDEYLLNDDNVSAAASRLTGGDEMMSRIWWDAKPGLPYLHSKQGKYPPEVY